MIATAVSQSMKEHLANRVSEPSPEVPVPPPEDDEEDEGNDADNWAKEYCTKKLFHQRWFEDVAESPSDSKEQKEAHKEAKALREDCEPLLKKGERKKILRRSAHALDAAHCQHVPLVFQFEKKVLDGFPADNLASIAKEVLGKEINNAVTRNTDSLRQVSNLLGAADVTSLADLKDGLLDIARVLMDNNVKLVNLLARYAMRGFHDHRPTAVKGKFTR